MIATLEMESYLYPRVDRIANVGVDKESTDEASFIAAVRTQQDTMMDILRGIIQHLEREEAEEARQKYLADDCKLPQNNKPPASQTYGDYYAPYKRGDRRPGAIVCRSVVKKVTMHGAVPSEAPGLRETNNPRHQGACV